MGSTSTRVLSGDIGGTHTRLAIFLVSGSRIQVEYEHHYASSTFAAFDDLLDEFLNKTNVPERAGFGVAGPVLARQARVTNLPWHIDADALQSRFGFKSCLLLNDLEAVGSGLPALEPGDFYTLHQGNPKASGNIAVIAAGTGLGEAGMYWNGLQHLPYATEGGHTSFSPGNDKEIELLRHLQKRHGHVSWERIVSGPGLVDLYEFHCKYHHVSLPDWFHAERQTGNAAAAISSAALNAQDTSCVETLDWFVRLYGAEAGNLALKTMSHGGLFVGGGIAPKILPSLKKGNFIEAFFSKGRMRSLLEAMPVRVILNDRVGLYGPALRVSTLAP